MIKELKLRKKLNRYDRFNNKFYTKVQNGFLKLANQNIKRYKIIDSNLDINLNEKKIIKQLLDYYDQFKAYKSNETLWF